MYIDNILVDIENIIYDARQVYCRIREDGRDANRVFNRVVEGEEYTEHGYETVADGLVEAAQALDRASEDLDNIEERLKALIYNLQMEALSAKVQSK